MVPRKRIRSYIKEGAFIKVIEDHPLLSYEKEKTMIELLSAVGSILLIDFVLSGDNALVIGAAAARLSRRQRRTALILGGAGAILLRIVFAFLASFLLQIAWLQAIGGLILLGIAIRLLADRDTKEPTTPEAQHTPGSPETPATTRSTSRSFLSALYTILLADMTMSLDNVLAVGALSHGNLLTLSLGIFLSIVILLVGSAIVAELMKWLPWLLDVAALVLAWTGANMLLHDQQIGDFLNNYAWTDLAVPTVFLGIVLIVDFFLRLRARKLLRAA